MAKAGVFVLSVDGASWNVLDPQMEAGRMPSLSAFLEKGIRCDLESVVPPITPSAWSSFHTGKNPQKHGVLDFCGFDPSSARMWFNSSKHIRAKTIWRILSEHGRRVGVVHVPMMYPPPEVNGVVVSGFETPSLESSFCYPPELRTRVREWFPDYVFGPDRKLGGSAANISALLQAGEKGLLQRVELVERLHAEDRFDVFMVNFQALDWLLHKVYLYVAEDEDPLLCPNLLAEVRAFIRTVDVCIGRLMRLGQRYGTRLILSDHGFTRDMGSIYPNAALEGWGYYVRRPLAELEAPDRGRRLLRAMERSSFKPARALAGAVRGWRRPPFVPWICGLQGVSAADIEFDLTRTRAAVVASDMSGLLYLNRHPSGPLANASCDELDGLRNELAERFRSLHNPLTRTPMFRTILDGAAIAKGEAYFPDLVLIPDDGFRALSAPSPLAEQAPMVVFVGKVASAGTHRPAGLLAANGDGLFGERFSGPCRLVDIAPTILTLARVPVPDDLDGMVIKEITGAETPVWAPSTPEPPDAEPQSVAGPFNDEELKIVEERLRSLGYLE